MPNAFRRPLRGGLSFLLILLAFGTSAGFAQSGSTGGSIGNDEKSLSGPRQSPGAAETPAKRGKAEAEEPRRASRKNSGSGGGGNSFDGAWIVNGVGVTCQGTSSNAVVVTSGKIIGQTARGTVSPSGVVYGTSTSNGITVITTGRLSGRSGGGTFRQSDGCTGRWTASKQ